MTEREKFVKHLRACNLAENTIASYLFAYDQFSGRYDRLTRENLRAYRTWLIENYSPGTVNVRIRGINSWLESLSRDSWKLGGVKSNRGTYLENVISEADYEYFKTCLLGESRYFWYFVIRFMASTGARVSELLEFKAEHVRYGYMDLFSKGGRLRRIYIPESLRKDAARWLDHMEIDSGCIFRNQRGQRITRRGIAIQLKRLAVRYGIDPRVVYPHSFRHRFAKSFLDRCGDISFLADLMGHGSIETTRVYLRKTAVEQRRMVDRLVDW